MLSNTAAKEDGDISITLSYVFTTTVPGGVKFWYIPFWSVAPWLETKLSIGIIVFIVVLSKTIGTLPLISWYISKSFVSLGSVSHIAGFSGRISSGKIKSTNSIL